MRMVLTHADEHESQWAAMRSIASKIGCSAEMLRKWVRQAERDQGTRAGLTTIVFPMRASRIASSSVATAASATPSARKSPGSRLAE